MHCPKNHWRAVGACVACLFLATSALGAEDDASPYAPLWPDGAPGAVGSDSVDKPALLLMLPDRKLSTGAAVVVCPGGGYSGLAMQHEGRQIGEWLNQHGIAAYILRYRLGPRYRHPAPLKDVQRALRTVRSRASRDGVDPKKVGVWGFSAGGHLAATAATHFDPGDSKAADPIDRESCRPDFAILSYPVITFKDPHAHGGSRKNLLGDDPSPELVESLSNETQVTARTPPTFLFHTTSDKPVSPINSVLFYQALVKAGVPAELHIYEKGPHGVGLAPHDAVLSTWSARLLDWLKSRGLAR